MDFHASGRTDNSNYYSGDSIDRDNYYRNNERRGRNRFSLGHRSDCIHYGGNKVNDRARDRDLKYLNRATNDRLNRRASNFIIDKDADNMRRNCSDVYRSDARRNLRDIRDEDFVTPPSRRDDKKSRNSTRRSSRRKSRSRKSNTSHRV